MSDEWILGLVERAIRMWLESDGELRLGQCIWNLAFEELGARVAATRGTPLSCFYDDSKIAAFLDFLSTLVKKK